MPQAVHSLTTRAPSPTPTGAPTSPLDVLRASLEAAIEKALQILDALDGDPDFEGQCEDEGFDSDSEEEPYSNVPTYQGDVDGSGTQTVIVTYFGGTYTV